MAPREVWRRLRRALSYQDGALMGQGAAESLLFDGKPPTWLALHGFCGTPEEMRLVVETAASLGFRAHAPVLAGHGTHARDLARLEFADLQRSAENAMAEAREYGEVLLVGLSLGSLLATRLVLDSDRQVAGLVLLSNAFGLNPFPGWPLRLVGALSLPDFGVPKFHADIGDPVARSNHLTYSVQPVTTARAVERAGRELFARLGEVRCPTLVVHGSRDRLCPVSNAWRVARQLGSRDKRVVVLPRSHHIVTRDVEADVLRRELVNFARNLGL